MKKYSDKLTNGLYLEDLDIFVNWNADKSTLISLLQNSSFETNENIEFDYFGLSVKSRFLKSDEVALITFNFVKNNLTSINVSFPSFGNDLIQSFEYTQHFLEEKLGKPINPNFLNKQGKKFKWKLKNVIIIHEIFESFSWRETLEISIR